MRFEGIGAEIVSSVNCIGMLLCIAIQSATDAECFVSVCSICHELQKVFGKQGTVMSRNDIEFHVPVLPQIISLGSCMFGLCASIMGLIF